MTSRGGAALCLAALVPLAGCSLVARASQPHRDAADASASDCPVGAGAPLADIAASVGLVVAARALLGGDCPESDQPPPLGSGAYPDPALGCQLGRVGLAAVGGGAVIGSVLFAGSAASGFAALSSCHHPREAPPAPVVAPAAVRVARPAPDPELDRLVAAYRSGLAACDDYVRAFASMQQCPVLAVPASVEVRRTTLIGMMGRFAEQGRLDPVTHAAARERAARRCQSGADQVRGTLASLSCAVAPGG